MRKFVLIGLLMALVAVPINAAKVKNAEDLISAMRNKYAGKWYKTLTFVQEDGNSVMTFFDEKFNQKLDASLFSNF